MQNLANNDFIIAYNHTMDGLEHAQSFHEQTNDPLTIDKLSPGKDFWSKLNHTSKYIAFIYEISLSLEDRICDQFFIGGNEFDKETKTLFMCCDTSSYVNVKLYTKLLSFITEIINSTYKIASLEIALNENDQIELGAFAACFIWMARTDYINLSLEIIKK